MWANNWSLELFIDNKQKGLSNTTWANNWSLEFFIDNIEKVQDLENRNYEHKIKHQIERSSFKQLPHDPRKQF